ARAGSESGVPTRVRPIDATGLIAAADSPERRAFTDPTAARTVSRIRVPAEVRSRELAAGAG
ncbi:MAG TPA: hypothetical protein VKA15_04755, partial [Isosphaeraceae bacterium]|nr:hypothetical protein [Isosphaeraceae bacterium]